MNAYVEILRPNNAFMAVIAVLLMAVITGVYNANILLAGVVVFLATGGGNTINDYFDYKIDLVNKPDRPIPSGRISLKSAKNYALGLFIISTLIAFYIGIYTGIITIISSILMYLYAKDLKKRGLIGNLTVSFLTSLSFVFGGIVVNSIIISIYLAFFAFLMTFSRELIKDMEDMEGDKIEGSESFPITNGKKKSSLISAIFILLAGILSPILYFNGIFGVYYLVILAIAILLFIYGAYSILNNQSTENCGKVSKIIKIGMLIAFLAFAFGTFNGL